jgi:hypothetical protein
MSVVDERSRVAVQDDGQTVRVLVFGSSGARLAEAEVTAPRALRLAQELLDAGLRHRSEHGSRWSDAPPDLGSAP